MYAEPVSYVAGLPRPGRCLVMGVLNVTPDSFSDGGEFMAPERAIAHGQRLVAEGSDIVDVGGESTRPGASRTSVEQELARVLPVVRGLAAAEAVVSVDTMRAEVAEQALAAGARLVNDVSGGQADRDLLRVVAEAGVPYICMHWRGHSSDMDFRATYADVVAEVCGELRQRVDAALAAGIAPERLAVDPGLGFAKLGNANWTLLARLGELHSLGHPVLVGPSRKRFLGELLSEAGDSQPRPAAARDAATATVSAFAAVAGAWCVRVHDAASARDAIAVATALALAASTGPDTGRDQLEFPSAARDGA